MNTTPFRGWFTRLAARPMRAATAPLHFRPSISGHGFRPDATSPRLRAGALFPGAASFGVPAKLNSSGAALLVSADAKHFMAVGKHHWGAMKDVVGLVSGCHQLGASGQAHRRSVFYRNNFLNLSRFVGQTGVRRQNRVVAGSPRISPGACRPTSWLGAE